MSAILNSVPKSDDRYVAKEQADSMPSLFCIRLEAEHLQAIEEISKEEKCPIDEVKHLFAITLDTLRSDALVENYLVLLTRKSVRSMIRQSRKVYSFPPL